MVLQSGPSKSAVYGTVASGASPSKISVTVTPVGGDHADIADAVYTVGAVVSGGVAGANATWKAFLKPTPAGGNFSVVASRRHACGTPLC